MPVWIEFMPVYAGIAAFGADVARHQGMVTGRQRKGVLLASAAVWATYFGVVSVRAAARGDAVVAFAAAFLACCAAYYLGYQGPSITR